MKNIIYLILTTLIVILSGCSQKKSFSAESLDYSLIYIKLKISDSITINDTKSIAANNLSYHCKITSFYRNGLLWTADKPASFSSNAKTFYIAPFEIPVGEHSIFSIEILNNNDSVVYKGITEEASFVNNSLQSLPLEVDIDYPTKEKPTNTINIPVISKEEIKASEFLFNVYNPNFVKGYSLPFTVNDCPNGSINRIIANIVYRENINETWKTYKPLVIDNTYNDSNNLYDLKFTDNLGVDNNLEGLQIIISLSDQTTCKATLSVSQLIGLIKEASNNETKVYDFALHNNSMFKFEDKNYPSDPPKPSIIE